MTAALPLAAHQAAPPPTAQQLADAIGKELGGFKLHIEAVHAKGAKS